MTFVVAVPQGRHTYLLPIIHWNQSDSAIETAGAKGVDLCGK
jgi:hypothetical protein